MDWLYSKDYKNIDVIGLCFVCICLGLFPKFYFWGHKEIPPEPQPITKQSCEDIVSSFSALYRATSNVGQIPYDADFANCYDHSKLLAKELEEQNIKSSVLINEDRSHAYIAVWVEANTGQFVPPNVQDRILEVRDGSDVNVVQCYNNTI